MLAIKAHFDGTVLIPDEPVDLPRDRTLIVHVESERERLPDPSPLRAVLVPSDPEAARRLIGDPDVSYLRKLDIDLDERSLRELVDGPKLGLDNF